MSNFALISKMVDVAKCSKSPLVHNYNQYFVGYP